MQFFKVKGGVGSMLSVFHAVR